MDSELIPPRSHLGKRTRSVRSFPNSFRPPPPISDEEDDGLAPYEEVMSSDEDAPTSSKVDTPKTKTIIPNTNPLPQRSSIPDSSTVAGPSRVPTSLPVLPITTSKPPPSTKPAPPRRARATALEVAPIPVPDSRDETRLSRLAVDSVAFSKTTHQGGALDFDSKWSTVLGDSAVTEPATVVPLAEQLADHLRQFWTTNPRRNYPPPQSLHSHPQLYVQQLTVLAQVNADHYPDPPPRTLPPFIKRLDDFSTYGGRPVRIPHPIELTTPWSVFFPSAPEQSITFPVDEYACVAYQDGVRGYSLHEVYWDELLGPTSLVQRAVADAQALVKPLLNVGLIAHHLAPTDRNVNNVQELEASIDNLLSSPLLTTSSKYPPSDHRAHIAGFENPEKLMQAVHNLNQLVDSARAIQRWFLHAALDAVAFLGGVELPTWPPSRWPVGYWVSVLYPAATASTTTQRAIARRRADWERWGVPSWAEVRFTDTTRLDVEPHGQPGGNLAIERDFQRYLQDLVASGSAHHTFSYPQVGSLYRLPRVAHGSVHPLDSPLTCTLIAPVVVAFLAPPENSGPLFDSVNVQLQQLLGVDVWSGKSYEQDVHGPNDKVWQTERVGMSETHHIGVLRARIEIPPPWRSPARRGWDSKGEAPPSELPLQAAVLSGSWIVLTIKDSEEPMDECANRHGAYGWRELLDGSRQLALKSADTANMLKDVAMSTNEVQLRGDELLYWQFCADPLYIDHLHSLSLSHDDRIPLLEQAPLYTIPPRLPNASPQEVAFQKDELAYHHWHLAVFGMFELDPLPWYDTSSLRLLFTQHRRPGPPLPSSPSPPSASIPLTCVRVSRRKLLQIAFSLSGNTALSVNDRIRLRRFSLVILALPSDEIKVSLSIIPPSYRQVLEHVVQVVQSNAGRNGFEQISVSCPSEEHIHLDTQERVGIYLCVGHRPDVPTKASVDMYVRQHLKYAKRSRSAARRVAKKGKGKT